MNKVGFDLTPSHHPLLGRTGVSKREREDHWDEAMGCQEMGWGTGQLDWMNGWAMLISFAFSLCLFVSLSFFGYISPLRARDPCVLLVYIYLSTTVLCPLYVCVLHTIPMLCEQHYE